jgi:hypothetical protein
VGIHPATLWRWLRQPEFQQALREARRAAFSRSIAYLQQAASAAVATLVGIMSDPEAPAGSRVRAAQCVVDLTQKGLEREEMEARVVQRVRGLRVFPGRRPAWGATMDTFRSFRATQ